MQAAKGPRIDNEKKKSASSWKCFYNEKFTSLRTSSVHNRCELCRVDMNTSDFRVPEKHAFEGNGCVIVMKSIFGLQASTQYMASTSRSDQ